ncbi:MAG: AbrB/MazE/SpoVT family DNA-binding domain-containing protein [Phyllobacteriaceae bacterium]|nr:AbrB/MazE/SpoVT family DNA-binding domain-containing protein [Phyllobacteriaceae bacterium]
MGAITTMTSKGQLTIPKEVRDALNLPAGTKFHVTAINGRVVAVPKNKSVADIAGMLGLPPSGRVPTMAELREEYAQDLVDDDDRIKREWHQQQVAPVTGFETE